MNTIFAVYHDNGQIREDHQRYVFQYFASKEGAEACKTKQTGRLNFVPSLSFEEFCAIQGNHPDDYDNFVYNEESEHSYFNTGTYYIIEHDVNP